MDWPFAQRVPQCRLPHANGPRTNSPDFPRVEAETSCFVLPIVAE